MTAFLASQPSLPRRFGGYELIAEIARGGMGVVYQARQLALNRIVALKVLIAGPYSSESLLRRFQTEAEAAAGLVHPGIVAIHEFGEHDGQSYYTMDFVAGRNLSEVAGGQPMSPIRAARYLKAIAEAVHFAHQRGILHRDLKPSNVLIDSDDRPRVTDFGLAKRLHSTSDATVAGQMLGSPNYAAPEQAAGRQGEVGVVSDVYALGGLLYNLLTARPPFVADSVHETLRLLFETEPVPPRVLNSLVPRDLETICLKCLEKTSARRYASAQALADELGRFLAGEPIRARPRSAAALAWRWARRHPAVASLAIITTGALVVTYAVLYLSAQRIDHARAQEQAARRLAEEELYASSMMANSLGTNSVIGIDPNDARARLDASRPRPGERDQRGFEWRYYWTLARGDALAVLRGHRQVVNTALFSPDGLRLATRSLDGTLKLWDAATQMEIASLPGVAGTGGFSADGRQFVFSKPDNSIWRLDLITHETVLAHRGAGRLIGALPDGRHVVVFGPDQRPVLRDLDDPGEWKTGAEPPIDTCAVVSADGRRAAVAGRPYPGILVLDIATGQQLAALVDPRPVIGLAVSPDGQYVVSAGFDGVLKVWDVAGGTLTRTIRAFVDPVWGLAFSQNGRLFAACGNNREIKIWDTSSWVEKELLRGHGSTVRCVAFSPDGRRLVSGAEDELVLLWPSHADRPPEEMPRLLRGPNWGDRTPSLAFSPDSTRFVGTAADGTTKIWRTSDLECEASFPGEARTVAYAPNGKSVLTESFDGLVQRWSLTGAVLEPAAAPKARFSNWHVDPLTPAERIALVADQSETRAACRLCDISSARDGLNAGAMMSTPTIAMSADGRTMFVGLPQGSIEAWDVGTRQRRFAFAAHKLGVTALAVSDDGQYLATGSLDNSTKLWDATNGQSVATFHFHNRPVWALAFSADGKTLAAGSCDKAVILCSVPLRRQVAVLPLYVGLPKGYEQEVRLLRFSPDGNILAAALGDGTLRFFRAAPFSETDAETKALRSPGL
ncbi:MAG: serine/threonine protein kinase [Opitutaceae bacterium]|nr:serine/threonine protein kinase [Opitutaceae bacterium]